MTLLIIIFSLILSNRTFVKTSPARFITGNFSYCLS